MKHNVREMRIEVHRNKKGEVTGHTVHHHLMPSKASKSGAFMEETHESYPFGPKGEPAKGGGAHLTDHVMEHLGLADAERENNDDSEESQGGEYA